MNVDHPMHLMPDTLRVSFRSEIPLSLAELDAFVQEILHEYFAKSKKGRELWHDHSEGIITDTEWTDQTLKAIQQYAMDRINEAE